MNCSREDEKLAPSLHVYTCGWLMYIRVCESEREGLSVVGAPTRVNSGQSRLLKYINTDQEDVK